MKKLIIFLIRTRLGLKVGELFQFTNQKSNAAYYFTDDGLMKEYHGRTEKSNVSLNWLLDEECKIRKELTEIME